MAKKVSFGKVFAWEPNEKAQEAGIISKLSILISQEQLDALNEYFEDNADDKGIKLEVALFEEEDKSYIASGSVNEAYKKPQEDKPKGRSGGRRSL